MKFSLRQDAMSSVQVPSKCITFSLDEQKQISLFNHSNFKYRQSDVSILVVLCDTRVWLGEKSTSCHVVHLDNNRSHHEAADCYFHGPGQQSPWNRYISLTFIFCNHFVVFSVCCNVIVTKLAVYNEKKMAWVPCGRRFFKGLDETGSISFKCMVWNHFVAFSLCYCVIITKFARYHEKNRRGYPLVVNVLVAFLWNNSVSAQRFFFRKC